MNTNKLAATFLFATCIMLLAGCEKSEGVGGLATIRGRVLVKDYNNTFTVLQDTYYAQDEEVYIIYGDEKTVGDRVNTTYDGYFEFTYLRPGDYTVYVYSKDSTLQTLAKVPVIQKVEIASRKELVELGDMIIFN
jgi:hypothetical protein